METLIKELQSTINRIKCQIIECYDDAKLPLLHEAQKEARNALNTLKSIK